MNQRETNRSLYFKPEDLQISSTRTTTLAILQSVFETHGLAQTSIAEWEKYAMLITYSSAHIGW